MNRHVAGRLRAVGCLISLISYFTLEACLEDSKVITMGVSTTPLGFATEGQRG